MTTVHRDIQTFEKGLVTQVSLDDVHATTPTEASLIAAFGAAASKGAGWLGVINDNGDEAVSYIVWSTGSKYFFVAGTLSA